jgi:uncharacterized protein YegJ (DUF2314 family)
MSDSITTPGDDEEILAAISEARRRLPEFRKIVEEDALRIVPAYTTLVKVCVESEITGAIEHIWLEGVYFEASEVGGKVVTPPNRIPEIEEGGEVRVPVEEVTDWMYHEDETMHGGFVERVLMKRSDAEG